MTGSPPQEGSWVTRQLDAMALAWERGERPTAAEVLDRFPEVDAEAAIRLVYEEVCLRREAGLEVDTTEIVNRYPRWGDEVRALLECDRLLGPEGQIGPWPALGENLGPFLLLAELGRGASGATYLAHDAALADRPVVVKVIPGDQEEHLALARLRHTHIVPLFSEHAFPERGLRALCMPYLGGASLASILQGVAEVPPAARSGRLLVQLIDQRTTPSAGDTHDAPFRRALERESYVRAVTWIAACLADALHYAHARGLVHMDVKPSNVLVTVDGQPMLLDFHLARPPLRPGEHVFDRLGGTPGWMAPEQRAAIEAVGKGEPVPLAVDGRADLFALGLILREALGEPGTSGRGRLSPSRISAGLAEIVRKCLAVDSSRRYPDAATLADDLRRHMNDLPLKGVANRDLAERWRKWRRRNPGAFAWVVTGASIALAGAVGLAVVASGHRQIVQQLQSSLEDARRDRAAGRFDQAVGTLWSAMERARGVPAIRELKQGLDEELRQAKRARTAQALHDLADQIRYRYSVDRPSAEDARALAEQCGAVWEQRANLREEPGEGVDETVEARGVRSDLVEVAAVWADLIVGLAAPEQLADARKEAMEVLDVAESTFGQSLALDLCRARLGGGGLALEPTAAGRSAWECYDLGRDHLRAGRFQEADLAFREALSMRPDDLWSNFHQGLCAFQLRRYEDAVAAFRACLALEPDSATLWYNRALALEALGQVMPAIEDYSRAIEHDPSLALAYLNRGVLRLNAGHRAEAIADFSRGLRVSSVDRLTRGRLHLNRALASLAIGDREAARADAEAAVAAGCAEAVSFREDLNAGRAVNLHQAPPARR